MSDYIKREDAIFVALQQPLYSVVSQIKQLEGIDIVRCKECKWADWYKTADGEQFCYCMETGNGGRIADDFCSYGERRSDE